MEFTRRMRKMRVHNPVRSKFKLWRPSSQTKNIPTAQILEDPFFKDSKEPYFIQSWTFARMPYCAWSDRIPSNRTALGYDTMYEELRPIMVQAANSNDPRGLGIIR